MLHPSSLIAPLHNRDVDTAGLVAGLLTLALAAARRLVQRRRPDRWATIVARCGVGVVLAPVAAFGLVASHNAPRQLLLALAVLQAGAVVAVVGLHVPAAPAPDEGPQRPSRPRPPASRSAAWRLLLGTGALVPGAALLALWAPAAPPGPLWVRLAVLGVTVAASPALWSFDRRRARLGPVLLVLAVGGMYATTPDTQQVLILLGAAAGVAVVAWWPALPTGPLCAPAVVGLVAWSVAVDGRGRHSAVVGGLACLGLLVVEPLAAALRRRGDSILGLVPPAWAATIAVAAQVVVVAAASRLAGLRRTPAEALVIAVPVLVAATLLLAAGPAPPAPDQAAAGSAAG